MSQHSRDILSDPISRRIQDDIHTSIAAISEEMGVEAEIEVDFATLAVDISIGGRTIHVAEEDPAGWTASQNGEVIEGGESGGIRDGARWAIAQLSA